MKRMTFFRWSFNLRSNKKSKRQQCEYEMHQSSCSEGSSDWAFQPFWPPWFKFFNLFGVLDLPFPPRPSTAIDKPRGGGPDLPPPWPEAGPGLQQERVRDSLSEQTRNNSSISAIMITRMQSKWSKQVVLISKQWADKKVEKWKLT